MPAPTTFGDLHNLARRVSQRSARWKTGLWAVLAASYVAFAAAFYPKLEKVFPGIGPGGLVGIAAAYFLVTFVLTFLNWMWVLDDETELAKGVELLVPAFNDAYQQIEDGAQHAMRAELTRQAQEVLIGALRIPLAHTATRPTGSGFSQLPALEMRRYLLGLLNYCALLLDQRPEVRTVRCGLILRNPRHPETYFAVLTYSPSNEGYNSTNGFEQDDFPAHCLQRFHKHGKGEDFHQYCHLFLGDTVEYERAHQNEAGIFQFKDDEQRKYLHCLLGVVLYVRHDQRGHHERQPLGVLSFDAPKAYALSEEDYSAALPYLRVAYRLLAIRVSMLLTEDEKYLSDVYGESLDEPGRARRR